MNYDNRIVVFCTEENFLHLKKRKTILMDGTFKSSPKGFKQLYTIVVFINGMYIPIIFILMCSKNEASYEKVCDFLIDKAPGFCPENVILDFEIASKKMLLSRN